MVPAAALVMLNLEPILLAGLQIDSRRLLLTGILVPLLRIGPIAQRRKQGPGAFRGIGAEVQTDLVVAGNPEGVVAADIGLKQTRDAPGVITSDIDSADCLGPERLMIRRASPVLVVEGCSPAPAGLDQADNLAAECPVVARLPACRRDERAAKRQGGSGAVHKREGIHRTRRQLPVAKFEDDLFGVLAAAGCRGCRDQLGRGQCVRVAVVRPDLERQLGHLHRGCKAIDGDTFQRIAAAQRTRREGLPSKNRGRGLVPCRVIRSRTETQGNRDNLYGDIADIASRIAGLGNRQRRSQHGLILSFSNNGSRNRVAHRLDGAHTVANTVSAYGDTLTGPRGDPVCPPGVSCRIARLHRLHEQPVVGVSQLKLDCLGVAVVIGLEPE